MKKYFLIVFFFFFLHSFGQDSKPYFQQECNYIIKVKLDDEKNDLNADEVVEYTNNSPDELSFIWFHIWPNAYKNNHTPLARQLIAEGNKKFYFATQNERGWIDSLDFKVNGEKIKTESGESIDIVKLILNEPLKPGAKITITTPFHVHIPIGVFSRLGHIGQQYQITQWYPKPAVYDKYGWHPIPYLNQGEFYSEYGKFDVFITVPKNYVVGATGDYVDGDEEIAWLNKKAEEAEAMEIFPRDTAFPPSSSEWKTLHFHQEKVHDFAWFADKRYYVMKDEAELPYSKRKVTTWGLFTGAEGKLWKQSAKYVADAVYYYSLWNGEYPYNHATAVDGALSAGGGMEYPNITVIGKMNDSTTLDRVIAHEVGHNWFYGILGSNERDHAWMDEGINSFNENRYMAAKYPPDTVKEKGKLNIGGLKLNAKRIGIDDLSEKTFLDLGYRFNAVQKKDQPVDMTSVEYTPINYGIIVYGKTAVILEYLQAYLGKELYDKCAQKYFEEWKFKHPYPPDIKKVYEDVSGKDLSWFFNEIIPTAKQIDYKISGLTPALFEGERVKQNISWNVKVKNKGGIVSPFSVSAIQAGEIISTRWYDGFSGKKKLIFTLPLVEGQGRAAAFDHFKIDAENKMPDINRQNNTLKRKGLFKQVEPLSLQFIGGVHNTKKTQLFFVPALGWNNYNKFMPGIAVYNNLIPEKKLEWVAMPMYGFGNKDLAGGASIHYNMHFDKIFQTVRIGVNAERYCYFNDPTVLENLNFNKVTPEISLEMRKKHLRSSLTQTIRIRQVNVTKEIASGDYSFAPPVYHYDTALIAINDFTYKINNTRKINPFDVSLNVQQGEGFVKSSVTADYYISFRKTKKGLDIRFFAGKFIDNKNLSDGNYNFYSSGAYGTHDYLYDNVFLGRSETDGFLSRQFAETEGNMKVYTPLGTSNTWLTSLNLKCSLPGKFPLKLFADFCMIPEDAALNQTILYDAGVYIPIMQNYVDVYFPLLMSKDINDVFELNNPDADGLKKYIRMIRFTFNIHKLNPFEIVRKISL